MVHGGALFGLSLIATLALQDMLALPTPFTSPRYRALRLLTAGSTLVSPGTPDVHPGEVLLQVTLLVEAEAAGGLRAFKGLFEGVDAEV